ncbi:hypothetical protein [Aliiglaciecola lipolytica]|uniref:MSHA biogenesis protein MshK n=1 Tax=Aliiglaciecola lipolytica E3 TaxID=1127673 RepID=K6XQ66_9ALTE|nr:hypothetical protein [Aliiglaciecola lipolytica]GAC13791.1 hypothetical protein GLIP_1150 [Aliiglaciecola lipolytica E3]
MIRKFVLYAGLVASFAIGAQQPVDPTKPKGVGILGLGKTELGETGAAPIVLSAVFIKNTSKIAVINGESVLEGQSWKGNQVKKIHKDGVVLVVDGRETELLLNQYSIKKDASNDF